MSRKPPTVLIPTPLFTEITDVVARTQRSVAFVVLRALSAAPDAVAASLDADRRALTLLTDDDDPPGTLSKIDAATRGRALDEALPAAWLATRERFLRWADREVTLRAVERADDLDAGLREAADPATNPARLKELAGSSYPRIRALVAAHAGTPADVRSRLARDREPYVREAASGAPVAGVKPTT